MKDLSSEQQNELREALSHMHVAELEAQLEALNLSTKSFNKAELINRLMHYALTGKELLALEIPVISQSKRGTLYPLHPDTKMMHGSYKNDLKTRQFFKSLIGVHFHFTAQGIDWLPEQWLEGKTPTYAEFAKQWQRDYEQNKNQKRAPKQEWAYNRFVQSYMKDHPKKSKQEFLDAWEAQRQKYVQFVTIFFKK